MIESLKRSIALAEANLIEISSIVRSGGEQLEAAKLEQLLTAEELQSAVLARLINVLKRSTGNDDFLTGLQGEVENLSFDPYPDDGEDDYEDDDGVLQQSIEIEL